MIRRCSDEDFLEIGQIINDGAQAYMGIIPPDRWTEPYMPEEELREQIGDGVEFWGYEEGGRLIGVMGTQSVEDVTLIRHAYIRSGNQKRGVGTKLLGHLRTLTTMPVLIGTWADAVWAIRFYQRHGLELVSLQDKDRLLRKYWSIPERQIETSVVLADSNWRQTQT